jgi:hypothetical protein
MVRGDEEIASASRILRRRGWCWPRIERRSGLLLLIVAVFTAGCACWTAPSTSIAPAVGVGPFLGPPDFAGSFVPKPTPATTGGDASYDGNIVFTNLDRALVEAILPPELKLASNSTAPLLHPVVYLYGHPHNTSWIVAGTPILVGPHYQELMLLIPFVQSGGSLWHTYVVRMYLDDLNAIWIGNTFFAYGKEWGTSQESGTMVTEFDQGGRAKFRTDLQITGPWQTSAQAATSLPNYSAIQTILKIPVVGRRSSGELVCSYFELNDAAATVAALQSTHQFLDPFVPGMSGWVALGSLGNVPNGAVAVRNMNWRIEQPPAPACQF